MKHPPDCEVMIVGGGLSGLSCAMFLAWHGVQTILVERHPDVLAHPRQRSIPPRIMEMYRQLGLEPRILAATDSTPDTDAESTTVSATTLSDRRYRPVDQYVPVARAEATSPCSGTPIDQDRTETLVRHRARELGAHIRFGTRLCGFTQHQEGVDVRLRDLDGTETPLCTRYLVAADGAHSPIRRQFGIPMETFGEFHEMLTVLLEADLRPALAGRTVHMAHLTRPRPRSYLMALDSGQRRWAFGTSDSADADMPDEDECIELVRQAVGDPELSMKLLPQLPGTDTVATRFTVGAAVAARYRHGRVFLIGDAAHLLPPAGGFAGATGVADAHNLAWKLAAVIAGQAGDALLDSYQAERLPVARFTVQQSLARSRARYEPRPEPGWGPQILDRDSVMMGYHYRSSAVVDYSVDRQTVGSASMLRGAPGTRAPHLWLTDAPNRLSTVDLYGSRFVLLTGEEGHAWLAAAHTLPVQVDAYRLGLDICGPGAAARHGLGSRGALLVRPDGFVAWRSRGMVPLPTDRLAGVLASVLSMPRAGSPDSSAAP